MHTLRLTPWLFSLFIYIGTAFAQERPAIDSLYYAANSDNAISSQEASQLLLRLVEEEYADSTDLAPGKTLRQQQMTVHALMGVFFFEKGSFRKGYDACQKGVLLARELNDSTALADVLSTFGACAMRLADYDEAVSSFEECIALAERMHDDGALGSAYSNLAGTYLAASTPENSYVELAEKYILKAIDIELQQPSPRALSVRYGTACEVFTKQEKFDEAIRMGQKAYELDSIAGNKLRMARRLSQIADAQLGQSDMKGAERHYKQSMALLEETGDPLSIAINCKQMGEFYLRNGNRPAALEYWTRGLQLAKATGYKQLQLNLLQNMYRIHRGYDDASAIDWLEQYTALKDSIFTERNNELLRDYQVRYETAEKEIIINRQRQTLRQRNNALIISIALIVILGITTLLLHGLRRHRKKRLEAEEEVRELRSIIGSQERKNIDKLTHYVALHINERTLSNEDICNYLAMSQSTLNRQLNATRGVSIQGFVQQMRMKKAKHLLSTTKESISDIADQCGYDDATYFARVFKQNSGMPPTKYRATTQKGHEK